MFYSQIWPWSLCCFIPILQMRKLERRVIKGVAPHHLGRGLWPRTRAQFPLLPSYFGSLWLQLFEWFHHFWGFLLGLETQFNSVQLLSHVQLFATPWTAAHQASLSITNSRSLLKLMSIMLVMPSNHLILCRLLLLLPQSFPGWRSFPMSQFFASGGQSIRVSVSASVLPLNIQDWFPLGWTDWISLLSNGLSRVFSYTTVQKHQFFGAQLSSLFRCF